MLAAIGDKDFKEEARSMGFVLFRRSICSSTSTDKNVWVKLDDQTKEDVKNKVLELIHQMDNVVLSKQASDLASEIAESMYTLDKSGIWEGLMTLAFDMVKSGETLKIQTGLNIYNFVFTHLSNELSIYNDQFVGIFKDCLEHEDLQIAYSALGAVANYLSIAQSKYTIQYQPCLEAMVKVPLRALEADDEQIIEDSLIEFNNIAESEPKFFLNSYKEIFFAFTKLVEKNDYCNMSIRHQPIEFLVSIADRQTSLIKEDEDMMKGLLDLVVKLMIDIDNEVDEDWLNPKPGFRLTDEMEEDSVVFGLECVNRIFHSAGEEKVLAPLLVLVENLLKNEDDWRFKNAGLHILSQIGDFVDDLSII